MKRSYLVEEVSAATPDAVFALLADASTWQQWAGPVVLRSGWEPGAPQGGLGAVRVLGLAPLSSREEIVEFDPPRRLGYVLHSGERLHHYRATVELLAAPNGGTRIVWSGTVERAAAPVLAALFHRLVAGFARRLARYAERVTPTRGQP